MLGFTGSKTALLALPRPRLALLVLAVSLPAGMGSATKADAAEPVAASSTRPVIKSNRWQEDWSPFVDPTLKTKPFDGLKYIPLFPGNPESYVSLGFTLRERFETNDATGFGIGSAKDSYLLQRAQIHIDTQFNEELQLFMQFEDARAFGKEQIGGADQNELDLRLAFLSYTHTFDSGTLKLRAGRQDFAFDLQRFVSSRDGPNVRQSFDAIWADWETGTWRILGFVSQPVQYADDEPFDDKSSSGFRFSTLRVERQVLDGNELSAYYGLYQRDDSHYLDATGDEERHVFDARFAGTSGSLDWDLEGMGQLGSVGHSDIRAWAIGARVGYTLDTDWSPRLGLQFDMASGDHDQGDGTNGTFNPLFPNGYYFSLGGYTGYSNLIHLKPSVTVKPADKFTVTAAAGFLWRQTVNDAIYMQPSAPVANTAGRGDRWTGAYAQLRMDYAFTPNLTGALEAVHYQVGSTLKKAGGHNSNYLGAELKYSW